jgi:hypothetical protein
MHHSGKSYNFPKGTLFTQLPGGIFAKHPGVPETHYGYGHLIRRSEDNIHAIHNALNGQQGVAEAGPVTIGSKLPKSDTATFGIEPGRGYKVNTPKDWKSGDRPRAIQQLIPTQDKKDHIRSRLGKHTAPVLPEQGVAEGGYSGIDDTDTVGFSVNSERAYNAVMARFGDQIDHDETSGILYVPARLWPKVEMVAFDADGEGAQRDDELENSEHYGVAEEVRLPYPEGSENLGRANMELLIRAYNEPTSPRVTLQFGNRILQLDREDIAAIAEYYDDTLPDNSARWNFIRAVMNNYDNFATVLQKIGRRSAANIKQPGLFQEAGKKKDTDDLVAVRDVALQRAITKAKSDFPTAGSGLEALAQDFMKSQAQDRRDFDKLQTAKRQHDQLLSQISKVDQEQQQEIQDLEDQNDSMSQRLQQLQKVNAELETKLANMTGRRDQKSAVPRASAGAAASATQNVVVGKQARQAAPKSKAKKQPNPTPAMIQPSPAMSNMSAQLAAPESPKLAAPDTDNILPPMFRRTVDPAVSRGKETATDIDIKIKEPAQTRTTATAESSKSSRRDADYGADYQDMVQRVAKLAKEGPRKTVWDPEKRVYKTVPVNPPNKVSESSSDQTSGIGNEFKAIKTVSDWAERLRVAKELQRDIKLMRDPEAKSAVQQRINDLLNHGIEQGYMK